MSLVVIQDRDTCPETIKADTATVGEKICAKVTHLEEKIFIGFD